MGDYTTATEVGGRLDTWGITIAVDSNPTTTQVEALITHAERLMNAALRSAGYTVLPLTDADDAGSLGGIVRDYVAAQVYMERKVVETLPETIRLWYDAFERWLGLIRTGKAGLVTTIPPAGTVRVTYAAVFGRSGGSEYT